MHRACTQSSATIETSDVFSERALERASATSVCWSTRARGGRPLRRGRRSVVLCLFGRDSIITSLRLLSVRPQVAQSTLSILASLQATEIDEFRDAQPGKILHELRTARSRTRRTSAR